MIRLKAILLTLLLLFAGACNATEETNHDLTDDAKIYAAAIREVHTIARSTGLVYVVTTIEDMAVFDGPVSPSQKLAADLQEAITVELADERFELIWIEEFDDAPVGPINPDMAEGWHIAEGDGIVITLGNIHPQDEGSVQLSFFMTCADVCGFGTTYILEQYSNNWRVTGSVGPEIAS